MLKYFNYSDLKIQREYSFFLILLFILDVIINRISAGFGYIVVEQFIMFSICIILSTVSIWIVLILLTGRRLFSAVLSIIISNLFFNGYQLYSLIKKSITHYEYFGVDINRTILQALIIGFNLVFVIFVLYKRPAKFQKLMLQIFVLFLSVVFVVEICQLAIQLSKPNRTRIVSVDHSIVEPNRPNIYYIVFDSYTSINSLKKYWNYSDKSFELFLKQKGLNVSIFAKSKFASTPYCISSYLNMRWEEFFIQEDYERFNLCLSALKNNEVTEHLYRLGYKVNNLSLFNIGKEGCFYTYFRDVSVWGNSLPLLLEQALEYSENTEPLMKINFEIIARILSQARINSIQHLPVFTYAHIMLPHKPYLVDSIGRFYNSNKEDEKQQYLSQLKFAQKSIVYLLSEIIKSDSKSIIIIQGDHGYRELSEISENLEEKYSIFNAVYLSGRVLSQDTLLFLNNPINNFKIVFNSYFRTKLNLQVE